MKTAKELADELDAQDRLKKRGYTKERCKHCNGIGFIRRTYEPTECFSCKGQGFHWQAPLTS